MHLDVQSQYLTSPRCSSTCIDHYFACHTRGIKNHTVDCRRVQRPITFSRTSLDASHLSNPARASHGKDTCLWNWNVRLYLWPSMTPSTEPSTITLTHMHISRYLTAWKPFPTTFSSVYIVWNTPIWSSIYFITNLSVEPSPTEHYQPGATLWCTKQMSDHPTDVFLESFLFQLPAVYFI